MSYDTKSIDFSEWISRSLKQTSLSPAVLAKQLQICRSTVYLWLSGKRILKEVQIRIALGEFLASKLSQRPEDVIREILWSTHISESRRIK